MSENVENKRLELAKKERWKQWGPYLSEPQWGTVREDYSEDGNAGTKKMRSSTTSSGCRTAARSA
jgi:hypothetical protein